MTYGFTKEQRSSFPYWFAHWCAFQMVALNLHIWKPKYLFHDIEKPWLRLFLPYEKVRKWHRSHSRHHVEWLDKFPPLMPIGETGIDIDALIIDNECSRYTKQKSPMSAKDYFKSKIMSYHNMIAEKCLSLGDHQRYLFYVGALTRAEELGL